MTARDDLRSRMVQIDVDERRRFFDCLREAGIARDSGSKDEEITALRKLAFEATYVFGIFEEDTIEDSHFA